MNRMNHGAVVIASTLGMIGMLALGGCAAEGAGGLTLRETKAPTQLLRNEAASRVDVATLLNAELATDASEGCAVGTTDTEGLRRSWRSGISLNINSAFAPEAQSIGEKLVGSFVDEGWEATVQKGSASSTSILQSAGVSQQIRVTVTSDADGDGLGAVIAINVHGACVTTEGPESEEVRVLER